MSTGGNLILTESVKYSLWSDVIMTFRKNHNSEWNKIDQQLIDSARKQWRKRLLTACVSARGGHVEHTL